MSRIFSVFAQVTTTNNVQSFFSSKIYLYNNLSHNTYFLLHNLAGSMLNTSSLEENFQCVKEFKKNFLGSAGL